MNAFIEFIKNFVDPHKSPSHTAVILDPTLYRIETVSHLYYGRILYQNDLVLKVQTEKPRVVKILKANIQQITIANRRLATQ